MRIFGVDPGSASTGYGCIDTTGNRHRLIACGALSFPPRMPFPAKLASIHTGLVDLISTHEPDIVAVEALFYAKNVRSALVLGHVRGIVLLAAANAGLAIAEYTPAEVKCAVVGYGRAEKRQVQEMIRVLLGIEETPKPSDVADALAVAVCHAHTHGQLAVPPGARQGPAGARDWRRFRPGLSAAQGSTR